MSLKHVVLTSLAGRDMRCKLWPCNVATECTQAHCRITDFSASLVIQPGKSQPKKLHNAPLVTAIMLVHVGSQD